MENGNEGKIRKIIFNEVSFIIAVVGVLFGAFLFLSTPTTENDIAIKLQEARIERQEETIKELTKTQQNEMQEVKNEIQGLRTEIQLLTNCITKLETIINERLPQ